MRAALFPRADLERLGIGVEDHFDSLSCAEFHIVGILLPHLGSDGSAIPRIDGLSANLVVGETLYEGYVLILTSGLKELRCQLFT